MSAFGLAAVIALLTLTGGARAAATLYVDDNDPTCGGNLPCFTTIQATINAAAAGDTINVAAGTYAEQLDVNKALTLLGPNTNINPNTGTRVAEAVIIPTTSDPLNPSFAGPIVVYLSAADTTFRGFTVDGDNPALTSGVVFNGADVDAEFGVYGDGSANLDAVIENFSGNVTTHPASVIVYNDVTAFRIGIRHNLHYVYSAPGFTIRNNHVRSYVQTPLPPQVTSPTTWEGIRVESIQQTVAVNVTENSVDGNRAALQGAGYTRVEGLGITNASATSPNIVFSSNFVTDNIRGIFHDTPAVPNFTCNSFVANLTGVLASSNASNGLVANTNNIVGNPTIGMQNDGPATLNAQGNWWGAANGPGPVGPGSGDKVSANVDFSNWLTAESNCPPPCATNVAASSYGATAVASSTYSANFPASAAINGERDGNTWSLGGGWNDGTRNVFPDHVEVNFNTSQTIREIDVYTLKNDFNSGSVVNDTTPATAYGIKNFNVQYWNGSAFVDVPGGAVTNNTLARRKFVFPEITTDRIRVVVSSSNDNAYSRVVEIEAFSCNPVAVKCVNNIGEPGCHISIQSAIDASPPNGQVNVRPGTYDEDVNVNKAGLKLIGAGAGSTTIRGPIGGPGTTVQITASNVTRDGNNTTDWNNPGLNSAGFAIQGQAVTGALIRDNVITGNRTSIDINNSNGHTVRNNVIDFNRTGLIYRNQTDLPDRGRELHHQQLDGRRPLPRRLGRHQQPRPDRAPLDLRQQQHQRQLVRPDR